MAKGQSLLFCPKGLKSLGFACPVRSMMGVEGPPARCVDPQPGVAVPFREVERLLRLKSVVVTSELVYIVDELLDHLQG